MRNGIPPRAVTAAEDAVLAVDDPDSAVGPASAVDPVLAVEDLSIDITLRDAGPARVIDGVSLQLRRGDRVGLVGESGSGKTMLGLSLLQLLPPVASVAEGRIVVGGRDLVGMPERQLCALRGRELAMVFQDPMTGLDPLRRVGSLLSAAAACRAGASRSEARSKALTSLAATGVPVPAERYGSYPHQLSGGLRQRVMIALALVNEPSLLVADEPTTALDATIQAQILELLRRVSASRALILITHDLGVAAEICDRMMVMYAGRIVEEGAVDDVLSRPAHPYTEGLVACRPELGVRTGRRLRPIGGSPPPLGEIPSGCAFAPRCPRAAEACSSKPPLARRGDRLVACWYPSAAGGGAPAPSS